MFLFVNACPSKHGIPIFLEYLRTRVYSIFSCSICNFFNRFSIWIWFIIILVEKSDKRVLQENIYFLRQKRTIKNRYIPCSYIVLYAKQFISNTWASFTTNHQILFLNWNKRIWFKIEFWALHFIPEKFSADEIKFVAFICLLI